MADDLRRDGAQVRSSLRTPHPSSPLSSRP
jgi:hypothetical protein